MSRSSPFAGGTNALAHSRRDRSPLRTVQADGNSLTVPAAPVTLTYGSTGQIVATTHYRHG